MRKELTAADLHVGQRVILRDINDRGRAPRDGEITKIGRKLVTIKNLSVRWNSEDQYRIDTQHTNDHYGHGSFRTLEQEAESQQRQEDIETLNKYGFRLDFTANPDPEDLHAVAEFLRSRP